MRTRRFFEVALGITIGCCAGIGCYTFLYAKGASYMTNNPEACANCHIMSEHYGGWMKGSHRSVATCNDCHTPPGLVGKYMTKASNGFWHSFAFTSGRFPDTLQIKPRNREVTESACRNCHADMADAIKGDCQKDQQCIRCHSKVGHF